MATTIVRLDTGSGLVFFEGADGATSWDSPAIAPEAVPASLVDPDDREQERMIHRLCGFDSAPAPPNGEAKSASKRMRRWMERYDVKASPASALALRWPQFVDHAALIDPPAVLKVTVQLSGAQSTSMTNLTVSCPLSASVGDVIAQAFRKFERSIGKALDPAGEARYVLKVVGRYSFMLEHGARMTMYTYVHECFRQNVDVCVSLYRLSEDDRHDLEVLFAGGSIAAGGASAASAAGGGAGGGPVPHAAAGVIDLEAEDEAAARSTVAAALASSSSGGATARLSATAAAADHVGMASIASGEVSKASICAKSTGGRAWRGRGSVVAATQSVSRSAWLEKQDSLKGSGVVQKQGWLHKKGGSRNTWTRRWCVLSGDALVYYTDETKGKEKGRVKLSRRVVQRPTDKVNKFPHGFEVTKQQLQPGERSSGADSGRTYQFYAKTDVDMREWMAHIGFCCGMEMDASATAVARTQIGSDGSMAWPFRIRIHGVENAPAGELDITSLFVRANLVFGGQVLPANSPAAAEAAAKASLAPGGGGGAEAGGAETAAEAAVDAVTMETDGAVVSRDPSWRQWLISPHYDVPRLPPATRIALTVMGVTFAGEKVTVAGVNLPLFNFDGTLTTGSHAAKLWPGESLQVARDPELLHHKCERNPVVLDMLGGVCGENFCNDCGILYFEMENFIKPVTTAPTSLASVPPNPRMPSVGSALHGQPESKEEVQALERIATLDPLMGISAEERALLWRTREYCSSNATLLPKFLLAVEWGDPAKAAAAREMLVRWEPFEQPMEAMELLDVRFGDVAVREFAVRCLDQLDDDALEPYLLQLVQLLKYELYHLSALARFLVRRALANPLVIGTSLYWLLKSEMHSTLSCQRFSVVIDAYVRRCGSHRAVLHDSLMVESLLVDVANSIKKIKGSERLRVTRDKLEKLNSILPETFQLGNWPHMQFKSIISQRCKVMDSKKKPLLLVLENADPLGAPIYIIFKSGDDLRQDLMTLQMIRIMDRLWLSDSLDLRMKPYGCCATGDDTGLIEIVTNSDTIANIQKEYGGKVTGAFRKSPIDDFLRDAAINDQAYEDAKENFIRSCAGYCVATFVLGIGDRHSDNIMVTRAGHLFHIDFGHFLGHFKSKKIMPGVKVLRERSPFVLDPSMAYVMGGTKHANFERFQEYCCNAYNLLRKNGSMFLNLFIDMIPAGMPELLGVADVEVRSRPPLGLLACWLAGLLAVPPRTLQQPN
jgi:phosphatidylinositol 3-kinase